VQTLNFVPYRVDLTPFAGVLSDGQQHTLALNVYNSDSYFSATAALLLFLDHGSNQVTGGVTENTIGAGPAPSVTENLQKDTSGNITGSVSTSSSREFKLAGFVNTSRGRVDTEVQQSVSFSNVQNFTINTATYVQDISQNTELHSRTLTRQGFGSSETHQTFRYPLTMNIGLSFAADGSFDQQTTVTQEFKYDLLSPYFASSVDNLVKSTDTLNLNSSGALVSNTGAQSAQSYKASNTRGEEYSCTLTAVSNTLTSLSEGCKGDR
jgi:hypothetical protein